MTPTQLFRVAIIHPWLPQYRAPFFSLLRQQAKERDILVDVYYGSPPPEWRQRMDAVDLPFAVQLPTRFYALRNRYLSKKSLKPVLAGERRYDLVVMEQAVRNLESYWLLARMRGRIAFWGHGRTYTKQVSGAQEALKSWMTRRGEWFFGYTQSGVDAVVEAGFPASRTTVVANAIDTSSLVSGLANVREDDIAEFRKRMDLGERVALYIGGLDASKRVDMLVASARLAHQRNKKFRLLVIGAGDEADTVRRACEECEGIIYLGPLFGAERDLALRSSSILMMPGRVGLVAVDSLASGLPIVTTDWPYHAPEFEYLTPGRNCLVTEDSVDAFVTGVLELLNDDERRHQMALAARSTASSYSIEAMSANFLEGLVGYRSVALP